MGHDTVRDVMEDRMTDVVAEYCKVARLDVDPKFVAAIVEEAFSVCGISEKEQEESW